MRRLVTAAMVAAALALGNCSGGQIDPQKVIDTCKTVCGFIPALGSVVALITADPAIASVEALANVICGGFRAQQTNLTALRAGQTVTFDVTVSGKTVTITGQAIK